MNCLKNYIKVSDLNIIVNQYLIGSIFASTLNAEKKNKNANLLGVDLYITKPSLEQLCLGGHILLVKKYIKCCSFDKDIINISFKVACYYGNLEIAQFLVDQGANNFNEGLIGACSYGHFKIVRFLVEHWEKLNIMFDLNDVLICACIGGHLEIVQFLVEHGKKSNTMLDINRYINLARQYENTQLANYLLSL